MSMWGRSLGACALWPSLLSCLLIAPAGCQSPTELTFEVRAPRNALLDPFATSVSDFVLKTSDGATIAAVSAGASRDGDNRLALGVLDPALVGSLRLDVLSGTQLVGVGRIHDVSIETGSARALGAEVRKPLVVVGSAAAPEATGSLVAPSLLDPTTSTDLATRGIKLPSASVSGFTADGQHLFLADAAGLSVFDTGTGTTVGPAELAFHPGLLALAPGDSAIALVEGGTTSARVAIYSDVKGLVVAGAGAAATGTLSGGVPRAAHFSRNGETLYVLVESPGSEPCTGAKPAANTIIPINRQGTVGAPIALPSYVSDFGIDKAGRFILAEAGADQISILTFASPEDTTSAATTAKLYATSCPTALTLLEDQLYVVTNDTNGAVGAFSLLRGRLDGALPTRFAINRPTYRTLLNKESSVGGQINLNLDFASTAIAAAEIAVSPDGNRAVFSTRTRYQQDGKKPFDFIGLTCTALTDINEYGLYSVDLVTGTASYASRSQNVVIPANPTTTACVSCEEDLDGTILELKLPCYPVAGDRAAGLSAAFAGSP